MATILPSSISTEPRLALQLTHLSGVSFDLTTLRRAAVETGSRLDTLVASNLEHVAMVAQLERSFDEQPAAIFPMPSGDELAAEVEQFLRNQND